ncbi:MAG TPA: hypothetical protein VMT20_19835 [Terriglobia bacterium]|nr:hypothetical protein [Terriglobia bacterium]
MAILAMSMMCNPEAASKLAGQERQQAAALQSFALRSFAQKPSSIRTLLLATLAIMEKWRPSDRILTEIERQAFLC